MHPCKVCAVATADGPKGTDEPAYASGMIRRVPNAPKTPNRAIRVPDDEWRAALAAAADKGEVLAEEVREFIRRYPTLKPRRRRRRGT